MPDEAGKQEDLELAQPAETKTLPPVVPPQTRTPFQFNQQINIQQIPPGAWERLAPDQIVDLSKSMMAQMDRLDERHFKWAMEQAKRDESTNKWTLAIGGVLAACGLVAVTYLAASEHAIVAAILGTFLATILAVVVGNRAIG